MDSIITVIFVLKNETTKIAFLEKEFIIVIILCYCILYHAVQFNVHTFQTFLCYSLQKFILMVPLSSFLLPFLCSCHA